MFREPRRREEVRKYLAGSEESCFRAGCLGRGVIRSFFISEQFGQTVAMGGVNIPPRNLFARISGSGGS